MRTLAATHPQQLFWILKLGDDMRYVRTHARTHVRTNKFSIEHTSVGLAHARPTNHCFYAMVNELGIWCEENSLQ